jgi:alkylation response protein AidB-like acyl-CoA dehydrogenase
VGEDFLVTYVLTDLEREIRSAAREVVKRVAPLRVRDPAASRRSELWRLLAVDLGWAAIAVPERQGGGGGSFSDLCLVLQELGRELVGIPLADTAIGAMTVLDGTGSCREAYCAELAQGSLRGALLFGGNVTAAESDRGFELDGIARAILGADEAELWLTLATAPAGPVLLAIDRREATGTEAVPLELADHTRLLSDARLAHVRVSHASIVAQGPEAGRLWAVARARRAAALASESVGIASACLDLARSYALQREQFGRVIGSFQAVKHRLADSLIAVEHAAVAARRAAAAVPDRTLIRDAAVAKLYNCAASIAVAEACFQVHGGISFTAEHPAHLFYRRAQVNAKAVWSAEQCTATLVEELVGVSS